mgnify:CR=1 FL=1
MHDFLFRCRYWIRFRTWPRDLLFARINLRRGREIYVVNTGGRITPD